MTAQEELDALLADDARAFAALPAEQQARHHWHERQIAAEQERRQCA